MIKILGSTEGAEYKAAGKLKQKFIDTWPDLEESDHDTIVLFVEYRVHTGRVKEIDIVVVADFMDGREIECIPDKITIKNFVLLLEVKGHDSRSVEFSGGSAFVRTQGEWKSATQQSKDQMHAFNQHLDSKSISVRYVDNRILFTQLRNTDLPDGNFLASNTSIGDLLKGVLNQCNLFLRKQSNSVLKVATGDNLKRLIREFESFRPTPLDRRKMDRIASDEWRRKWLNDIGQKQIIIRGRGGTGKTVALMQLADHAYRRQNKRSLLMTYNKALVADLTRMKQLIGIPDSIEGGGIKLSTIHRLISVLARDMGIPTTDFYERFQSIKKEICNYIDEELFTHDDRDQLKANKPYEYRFDIVFIDEGQDWPDDEIKIVRWLFGLTNIVVADGVDQIVRDRPQGQGWDRNIPEKCYVRRPLKKGVRMKYNLAWFMADMAWECFGIDGWDVDPDDKAIGGRIVVYEGDLVSRPEIFRELCLQAQNEGNFPIDLLACVPPALVDPASRFSRVSEVYQRHGIKCWDGCSDQVRKNPPDSVEQLRIVQYESSRGLEGWTVLNFCLDEFWELKLRTGASAARNGDQGFLDADGYARRFAGQWLMIPLSRAIDTLVINLVQGDSVLKDGLQKIYSRGAHESFDWIHLD